MHEFNCLNKNILRAYITNINHVRIDLKISYFFSREKWLGRAQILCYTPLQYVNIQVLYSLPRS